MENNIKRLLCLALVLVLSFVFFACDEGENSTTTTEQSTTAITNKTTLTTTTTTEVTVPYTIISSNGFTYTLNDDGDAVVVGYVGAEENVEIPQTIGGKQVVEVGFGAFRDSGVKSVVVPFGVTTISAYAFFNSPLESIIIPDTVTFIGNNAFSYTNLTEFEAPLGISAITAETFSFCERLESVILGDNITYIEDAAFAFCPSLEAVYIPYSVDYIADDAFEGWFGKFVIYGEEDSYAEQYAEDMEMNFEIV